MENRNLSGQERLVARHICASLYEGLSADVHPSVCPSVRSFFTESTFLDSRNRGKMSSSSGVWALVMLFGVLMICHAGVQAEGIEYRLAGGPNAWSGRVEVKYEDEWGGICAENWDNLDATVLCRQLGFASLSGIAIDSTPFAILRKIWISGVDCSGSESRIEECPSSPWGTAKCFSEKLAAVRCAASASAATTAAPTTCSNNNGGCSHDCSDGIDDVTCTCPTTLVLGKDRKTCENPNIFDRWSMIDGQGLPKVVYTQNFDGGFTKGHGWEVSGGSVSSTFCGAAFHQAFDRGLFFDSGVARSATTPPVDLSVYGKEWAPALFFQVQTGSSNPQSGDVCDKLEAGKDINVEVGFNNHWQKIFVVRYYDSSYSPFDNNNRVTQSVIFLTRLPALMTSSDVVFRFSQEHHMRDADHWVLDNVTIAIFRNDPCLSGRQCENDGNCVRLNSFEKRCDCKDTFQGEFCEDPANFDLSDLTGAINSILSGLSTGADKLAAVIKNIKDLVKKISSDADGDKLLGLLKAEAQAASAPVFAAKDNSCDPSKMPDELMIIKDCLVCTDGNWNVRDIKYADCKPNGGSIKAANLAFLLLPLLLLKVFM